MSDYRPLVDAAIRATTFHSPTSYSWFGKPSPAMPRAAKRAFPSTSSRVYLLFHLQLQLYNDFYRRGFAAPSIPEASRPAIASTFFTKELSAANSGAGCWEDGWEVTGVEDGTVVVRRRDGLSLWATAEDVRPSSASVVAVHEKVNVRLPKEFLAISPGFYTALSDRELPPYGPPGLVRFYWNLTAEGAIRFMRDTTTKLNVANLPFRLKALNDPTRYNRCDAVVLYAQKSDYEAVREVLEPIHDQFAQYLKNETPGFTKRLAPGLGFAEDPGDGQSFGLNRCRILAGGMLRAHEEGRRRTAGSRLAVVEEVFREAGLSLDQPFLSPGSEDRYNFQPSSPRQLRSWVDPRVFYAKPEREALLHTAEEIAQRLCRDALWSEDRCSWMGIVPATEPGPTASTSYSALGSDLYHGTSGISLFLAELAAITGDATLQRTALGAITQALSLVDAVEPRTRLGLYTGWTGIAFAAARVGAILNQGELLSQASRLLERAERTLSDPHESDLISGRAGAIVGFLTLRDLLDEPSLLDFAVRLGGELAQAADRTDGLASWAWPAFPNQRNLTGLSHGTAGMALGLLELSHATEDRRYAEVARSAFEYERRWFDASVGHWPDFRGVRRGRMAGQQALSFATLWCHGAPGIALSRLRAYEAYEDEASKSEAVIALRTTRKATEEMLSSHAANFCLCHGLAGNADILLSSAKVFSEDAAENLALAQRVAAFGIKAYASGKRGWPCGGPSFMTGLAGVGYFYLRMSRPATPSLLLLRKEEFAR